MREITILASGPSVQRVLHDPSLIEGDVAVVNSSGILWPGPIRYWITLHPEKFRSRWDIRMANGHSKPKYVVVPDCGPGVKETLPIHETQVYFTSYSFRNLGGSSSMYAVLFLSRIMQYQKMYLFGIDLTEHYCEAYYWAWDKYRKEVESKCLNYPNVLTHRIVEGLEGIYPRELPRTWR